MPKTYIITIPDPFLDILGDAWKVQDRPGVVKTLGFTDVLIYTVRQCPVGNADDADRALRLIRLLMESKREIVVEEDDLSWLTRALKDHGHRIWLPADSAFLRECLEKNTEQYRGPKPKQNSKLAEPH